MDTKDNTNAFIKDFPLIKTASCIYFDNAATVQRPQCVIDSVVNFTKNANANPLRGLYDLSVKATKEYEKARDAVANFLNAKDSSQIIFTRNTTESINLVAFSYALANLKAGDEIVLSIMEHHSNLLPWQRVAQKTGAKLVFLEPTKENDYIIEKAEYEKKITHKTKIVALCHISNVLGCVQPIKDVACYAHKMGAVILVDGAQSAPHIKVDVEDLDCDFFAFSGHKLGSPFGIGVLYAKKELLENMEPFLLGGEMIEYVSRQNATYAELPHKFEAGTVNVAGAVGLHSAIDYITKTVGFDFIQKNDEDIVCFIMEQMQKIPHVHIIGSNDPKKHSGIVTFCIDGVHPHDIASMLDSENIAIRAGHHCAQPLMEYLGATSTARVSVWLYNTQQEAQKFIENLKNIRKWSGYGD